MSSPVDTNIDLGLNNSNQQDNEVSTIKSICRKMSQKPRNAYNDFRTKTKPYRALVRKFNSFFSRHYVLLFIIILIVCFIINWYVFSQMDPNGEADKMAFNRIIVPKEGVQNEKEFISNNVTDSLYFTLTTFSTIGYGDITPRTTSAKAWCGIMHTLVILFTYKLYEHYMTVDKSSDENSLFAAYKQVVSDKEHAEDQLYDYMSKMNIKRSSF